MTTARMFEEIAEIVWMRPNGRELDVLALLAEGFSTKQIATRLSYSERTIKNVLQDVTTRLNARNRTEAVVIALRAGWIS